MTLTTSGPRRYVQLIESYRDEAGRVRKRTVATLGRLDQLTGELDSVIDGLLKVADREPVVVSSITTSAGPTAGVSFESARAFRRTRHTVDVEALIRIMVLNRGEAVNALKRAIVEPGGQHCVAWNTSQMQAVLDR